MTEIAVIASVPEGASAKVTKTRTGTDEVIGDPVTFNGVIQFSIEEGESIHVDNVAPAAPATVE